jgi:exopolysaccharide biosynthesis polyprenyl glycosylphosphotransferase
MQTSKQGLFPTLLKMLDILLMLIALAVSLWMGSLLSASPVPFWEFLQLRLKVVNLLLVMVFIPLWHLICLSTGLYTAQRLEEGKGEWKEIARAVLIGSMLLLTTTVVFQRGNVSKDAVLFFAGSAYSLIWTGRTVIRHLLGWLRRHNHHVRHLLLVGSNQRAYDFACRILSKPQLGYRIMGYIDVPPNGQSYYKLQSLFKHLGTFEDFDAVIEQENIDEVVISLPIRSCYECIRRLIEACEVQGIRAHLLSDFFQLKIARAHATDFDGMPLLTLATGSFAVWPAYLKRLFDVVVSVVLVVLLSPVFLLIALCVKISSPNGPAFFVQTRVGYNRRRFKMIKFRTMIPDAERLQHQLEGLNEAQGPVFKIKNDPRITPLGRLLRKTSLDELPQLFNVIKGDMSLVGPRPLPQRDVERFEDTWLKRRFSVKPGITCLWQVNGRNDTDFGAWIAQDLEYIDHWSFGLDLKILAKTIPAVLRGTGAY